MTQENHTLVNGEPAHHVSIMDRGLLFGDGVFETIALKSGRLLHKKRHLARLQHGCEILGLAYPGNATVEGDLDRLLKMVGDDGQRVVKIVVTRGEGGFGYAPPVLAQSTTRIAMLLPWPESIIDVAHGLSCALLRTQLGSNRQLAGLKHLNRLENVLAARELCAKNLDEGLMSNEAGFVIEAVSANVFFVFGETIVTPTLDTAGVNGITRGLIIEQLHNQGVEVSEEFVFADTIHHADEIILCNSVRGVRPVGKLGDTILTARAVYRRMAKALAAFEQ